MSENGIKYTPEEEKSIEDLGLEYSPSNQELAYLVATSGEFPKHPRELTKEEEFFVDKEIVTDADVAGYFKEFIDSPKAEIANAPDSVFESREKYSNEITKLADELESGGHGAMKPFDLGRVRDHMTGVYKVIINPNREVTLIAEGLTNYIEEIEKSRVEKLDF